MLKIKLGKILYFEPIWPPKFKMAAKVKKILQKIGYNLRITDRFQCSITCLQGISFGQTVKFTKISYFVPVWPPKFKISDNVEKSPEKLL